MTQSGKDATQFLRQRDFNNIIIGVTGNSLEEELQEFLAAGANLVFTKPLVSDTLDSLLQFFHVHGCTIKADYKLLYEGKSIRKVPV